MEERLGDVLAGMMLVVEEGDDAKNGESEALGVSSKDAESREVVDSSKQTDSEHDERKGDC